MKLIPIILFLFLICISLATATFCYQETATTATSCGGLDNGSYSYSGGWFGGPLPATNIYDGDYSTLSLALGQANYYVNYSKVINASYPSYLQVKDNGGAVVTTNITIPLDCFSQNSLMFQIDSDGVGSATWSCYNGTTWNILRNLSDPTITFYEEGVFWNIGQELSIDDMQIVLNNEVDECYQETANVSTICGGLDTGSYDLLSTANYMYINYTKPSLALNTSLWLAKDEQYGTNNYTIPSSCWNYNDDKLLFRIYSKAFNPDQEGGYCYNGTTWVRLWFYSYGYYASSSNPGASYKLIDGDWNTYACYDDSIGWASTCSNSHGKFYEEAMYWKLNTYGVDLKFNTSVTFDELNINDNGVMSNISLVNTYLDIYLANEDFSIIHYPDYLYHDYTFIDDDDYTFYDDLPYIITNLTLAGFNRNITAELGSIIEVYAEVGQNNSIVCVDINHPEYGTNYSCSTDETTFNLNVTYFRKTELSNGTTKLNLTYTGSQNKTIYISAHQYDEVRNLTLNMTGYDVSGTYAQDVKIYINDTLAASPGDLFGELTRLNVSNGGTVNTTFTTDTVNTVGYLKLPKNTTISNARLSLTGFNHTYNQAIADYKFVPNYGFTPRYDIFNYTYKNRTFQSLDIKHGDYDRYNHSMKDECINNGDEDISWRILSTDDMTFQCYNSTDWVTMNTTTSIPYSQIFTPHNVINDGDYNTYGCMIKADTYRVWAYEPRCGSNNNFKFYDNSVWWESPPSNVWLEVGDINGTRDWSYSGLFNDSTEERSNDFTGKIQNYLLSCTADDDGFCYVPVQVSSDIGGIVQISDISVNYTINVLNPITIDKDVLQGYLNESDGFVQVPITIESSQAGIIEISDIKYDYAGGNDTIAVTAHTVGYTDSESINVTYYHSRWKYNMPKYVDYLEFIPRSPVQNDVQPYGQTYTVPIFNLTSLAYGAPYYNFTFLMNETYSCVNVSYALNSTVADSTQLLDNVWQPVINNVGYEQNYKIWMWADYNCNRTNWYLWDPYFYLRACKIGVDVCDHTVN